MKNWYLLLVFIFLITACSDDDKVQELREIKIEKYYSYFYGVQALDEVDDDVLESFDNNVSPINSVSELNANPLYNQCPDDIKEELNKTDFEKYTIVMIGSFSVYKVTEVKYRFGYSTENSEYRAYLTYYYEGEEDSSKNIYLNLSAFLVKKITDNSRFSLVQSISSKK